MNLTCEFDGIIVFYDVFFLRILFEIKILELFFRFYEVWALKSLLC